MKIYHTYKYRTSDFGNRLYFMSLKYAYVSVCYNRLFWATTSFRATSFTS
jgi:hypothetical protein